MQLITDIGLFWVPEESKRAFFTTTGLEMMIEDWGPPLCSNRLESALDLNLIIETFSIGILILFLFVRLNSSQSQLSWGVWSKWLCGHSYHTFTTQRKPTSRGLVQYNIVHVINKWWDYCRHSWSQLVLDFLFVISTRPQWLGFYGLLVCGNWLM